MFILNEITMNCGATSLTIDSMLPQLVTTAVNLIKIGIPILLIIFGMMDLGKAVMAQKEDEIKKGWQTFVKRMAAAVIVFLVVFIVQIVFNLVAGDNKESTWNCVKCFIDYNESECNNG